ncbi:MAG TPA: hypothetical protein VK633_02610 [Verrucomicrobiae bacterium]|nr:hypothetical protein [Verrucomicrobiae bacterium]
MNRYVAFLISALLTVIVVQWVMLSRAGSENRLLYEARRQAEQSRSELEQTLEAAKPPEGETESLRIEVARLRADAQSVRQAWEGALSRQSPSAVGAVSVLSVPAPPALPLPERNRVLLEYIGEPVDLDPSLSQDIRYTKESIISAVQLAAQYGGVSVQRLEAEDSEFPCLVGIFCEPQDYAKLVDELKKLDGYEYNGSVGGSDIFHVLNITPARAYPNAAREQIGRRVTLRQQVFYRNLSVQK